MDRRQLLRSLRSGLAASLIPSFLPSLAHAAKSVPPAALLVPLSGPHAALGRSMARAALFAQAGDAKGLFTLDTGGTPAGAAAAAMQALKRGAGLILGPVFADEVRPVLGAVNGRMPVIAFSNDASLVESGAFLLGITAEQAVAPLIAYARGRGVRSLTLLRGDLPWDIQVADAAARAVRREGMTMTFATNVETTMRDGKDAILLSGGATAAPTVRALKGSGIQPLAAFAGLDPDPAMLAALEGVWMSAPDPSPFGAFAQSYEAQNGGPPGVIAGLARDAAGIAIKLRQSGGSDRSAVLAAASFGGVCGDVRFHDDGTAARAMTVLTVESGSYRVVQRFALS